MRTERLPGWARWVFPAGPRGVFPFPGLCLRLARSARRGFRPGPALCLLLAGSALGLSLPGPAAARTIHVAPPDSGDPEAIPDLAAALGIAGDSVVVEIAPGTYDLSPEAYLEDTCGNCEAESTQVAATVGLRVTGKGVHLRGAGSGKTVIRTNAGYGILFEDCSACSLSAVTVTGGERDTSAMASDAAIVAKRSAVVVEDCVIRDNIGDSTTVAKTVVGIMGVCGRSGSFVTVRDTRILRNSWDGIAMYRGAQAVIEGNIIDGVDLARGDRVGGGRGVGIGVTWDAFVSIRGNLVRRYWKGIGAFVDAQVTVEENVVEHIATWGMTLWDAGKGRPSGNFQRNIIYDTGACGMSVVRSSDLPPPPGRFVQNALVKTGQDPRYDTGEPYCEQTPIARPSVSSKFAIGGNIFFGNRERDDRTPKDDMSESMFDGRLAQLVSRMKKWPSLEMSDFWKDHVEGLEEP